MRENEVTKFALQVQFHSTCSGDLKYLNLTNTLKVYYKHGLAETAVKDTYLFQLIKQLNNLRHNDKINATPLSRMKIRLEFMLCFCINQ